MRLIKPSHKIEFITPNSLELIEAAGRTCYKSEDKITQDSAEKFVSMVIKRGHHSVIEHANMTVRFICDRGVTHEIVRHRLFAYSQESTRYCNYKGGVTFIIPSWVDMEECKIIDYTSVGNTNTNYEFTTCLFLNSLLQSEAAYLNLLESGYSPQQARAVLPNSLKTEIVCTANFREWRHVFTLRCSKAAHPQMRELMIPLLEEVKTLVPVIFDDIEY
jgi:thymidylate synthase (FAD)